ncbi:MAG: thioesterase [Actinomycetota bacterium]|nr:thioesterase [Actinomycetota bacterium]
MDLTPGLHATVALTVGDADTAVALGSGDVAVLGTPRVVALAEQAAVAAVQGALPPERTSVGTRVELDHLAASRVGATVTATAELTAVEGRRLTFTVVVREGDAEVARGRHLRAVVDRARFAP